MFVLDTSAVRDFQSGVAPVICPMLTDDNVGNKFIVNISTLPDQGYDDV